MGMEDVAAAIRRVRTALARRPDLGLQDDSPATARWERGVRIVACHANGKQLQTDMPTEIGGTGDQVTPGWLFRAGLASCSATSIALGAAVAVYYVTKIPGGTGVFGHTMHEYFSFIVLIGSLFVVAGGIHIKVKGEATPLVNVVFLIAGAVISNFIGTTGASMVLTGRAALERFSSRPAGRSRTSGAAPPVHGPPSLGSPSHRVPRREFTASRSGVRSRHGGSGGSIG